MMKRTEDIVHMALDFLPLKSYVNIVCGNALRIDWNSVVPARELTFCMGIIWSSYQAIQNVQNEESQAIAA